MNSWISMFTNAAEMFLFLAVELSALFFLISAGVSLIRQKIPDQKIQSKRAARTVLTGMCYSVGSATRQGSSSLTRFIGQSAITSSTWRR